MPSLVRNYIAPPFDTAIRTRKLYRATLLVGPMGSGKTLWTENKLGELIQNLLNEGVDEQQICYVYAQETRLSEIVGEAIAGLELPKCVYLYIFNDDAAAAPGGHGRRAMAGENVEESQYYIMIRHRLEKHGGFKRYLHVLHATQVYSLIDVTFRRTAALKVFKDYPDEPADHKIMSRMLGAAGMQALLELSVKLYTGTPEDILEAANTGVALFKRYRRIVKAKHGARDTLEKIQYIRVQPEDHDMPPQSRLVFSKLLYIMQRLRKTGMLKYGQGKAFIQVNGERIYLARAPIVKKILGEE